MNHYNSDDTFNHQRALKEANEDLQTEQRTWLDLGLKSTIEQSLHRQFAQVRKAGKEKMVLQRKAIRMSKAQSRLVKSQKEARRRMERKLKRLEREAYDWATLGL